MPVQTKVLVECPGCGASLRPAVVKTCMWVGDKLYAVEDVPAQLCDSCAAQFYDEETTAMLRRLKDEGFASMPAQHEILVPVFSLRGRVT